VSKFVFTGSTPLANSICEGAGINPNYVRRMVIDLTVGEPGKVYVELLADAEWLDVRLAESDIVVIEKP